MAQREKIFGIAIKAETTPLTDAVPDTTNGLQVVGIPTLKYDFLESGKRDDVVTGQRGAAARTDAAARWGSIDLRLEVRGAGGAYSSSVLPPADPILLIAGLARTLVTTAGSELVRYTTIDTPSATATLYCYGGGKVYKLVGCIVSAFKYSVETPHRAFFDVTVTGVMTSDPVQAALPVFTYASVLPPLLHSAANNIGSWTSAAGSDPLVLQSAMIDLGIVSTDIPSAGATDGHAGYLITDGLVRQELTMLMPLVSSFDVDAMAKATGAALPTTAHQVGTVQYNRLKVQTGKWQLEKPELGSRNGLVTVKLAGNLLIGAAPTSNREVNFLFD